MNSDIRAQDRAIGALLGLAVGDAVGTTLEFKHPGEFDPITDMVGGGPFHLRPGEWTDDTSMALCLAESLIETRAFDPVDQLTRYVRWWREGHHSVKDHCFDIGNQVRAALDEHVRTKKPWCGPTGECSAGNGSLMRLAPIAIAYASSPEQAIHLAGQSSRTTHQDRRCIDACRYFAALLVGAIHGHSRQSILQPMYCPVDGLWQREPLHPAIATIAQGSFKCKTRDQIESTGFILHTLEAALWAFYSTTSFEQAILAAANLGDDADTTAAVCGQIAGAFYGLSGIPNQWLDRLARRQILESFARRLWQISSSHST